MRWNAQATRRARRSCPLLNQVVPAIGAGRYRSGHDECDDVLSDDDRAWSPPDTLAGKLERGLGSGFLGALEATPGETHALLTECILNDPRWDHQIDERQWYYGELARRTALPVSILANALLQQGAQDPDGEQWVTLGVLQHLARYEDAEAIAALRDYIGYGDWWFEALLELGRQQTPATWAGLDALVAERIQADPFDVDHHRGEEPFRSWAKSSPKIRAILASERRERPVQKPVPSLRGQSTEELLASPPGRVSAVLKFLAKRRSAEDKRALRAALRGEDDDRAAIAMAALALQGDRSIEAAAVRFVGEQPAGKTWRRILALRAIVTLPASTTLPLAREWRDAESWELHLAARRILEAHATDEDVPWLLGQLRRDDANDQMYATSSALRMISRFPRAAAYNEVRALFSSLTYSYGRHFAAEALLATDPEFPVTLASECLWDCESATRRIGVRAVDLSLPGVRARLAEMTGDLCEETDTQSAAAERLPPA